jgi:hypothetical protein
VRRYIYTSLRGQVCARVMTITTRQVSAVTPALFYLLIDTIIDIVVVLLILAIKNYLKKL